MLCYIAAHRRPVKPPKSKYIEIGDGPDKVGRGKFSCKVSSFAVFVTIERNLMVRLLLSFHEAKQI